MWSEEKKVGMGREKVWGDVTAIKGVGTKKCNIYRHKGEPDSAGGNLILQVRTPSEMLLAQRSGVPSPPVLPFLSFKRLGLPADFILLPQGVCQS